MRKSRTAGEARFKNTEETGLRDGYGLAVRDWRLIAPGFPWYTKWLQLEQRRSKGVAVARIHTQACVFAVVAEGDEKCGGLITGLEV